MLSEQQIAELRRLEKAATPGKWTDATNKIGHDGHGIAEVDFDSDADRELVIALRNAASALLDAAADAVRLREAVRKVRRSDLPDREQPLWDELQAALRPAERGGGDTKLCYPFAVNTCDRPGCSCRRDKADDIAAAEQGGGE